MLPPRWPGYSNALILTRSPWLIDCSMKSPQGQFVPGLWHLEVANALLTAERRGVAKEAEVIDYRQRLARLPIMTLTTSKSPCGS